MVKQTEKEKSSRTVKIKIRFFTDDLPKGPFIWSTGTVALVTNRERRIRQEGNPLVFHDINEIGLKVIELLKKHGIAVLKKEGNKKVFVNEFFPETEK